MDEADEADEAGSGERDEADETGVWQMRQAWQASGRTDEAGMW